MKRLWKAGLLLALGSWTQVHAQDVDFQPIDARDVPLHQAPVRVGHSVKSVVSAAPVSISRPVPIQSNKVTVDVEAQSPRIVNETPGIRTEPMQPLVTEIIDSRPGQPVSQPPMQPVPMPQKFAAPLPNPVQNGAQPRIPPQPNGGIIVQDPMGELVPGPGQVRSYGPIIQQGPVVQQGPIVHQGPIYSQEGGCGNSFTGMPAPYHSGVVIGDSGGSFCSTGSCAPAGDCFQETCCYPRAKVWLGAEYLSYTFKDQTVPPLVTRSNNPGLGIDQAGALGQPGTRIIYGGDEWDNDARSGGRIRFGFWFPRNNCWGIDASAFWVGRRVDEFIAGSNGNPVFARPINFVDTGEGVQAVAFPGVVAGNVQVNSQTKLYGADINLRRKLFCGPRSHFDLLLGFRHLQLDETIDIQENLTAIDPVLNGFNIQVLDSFQTRNIFNGGQIGFEHEFRFWRRMFLQTQFKFAMGNMAQRVNISGSTTFTNPNAVPIFDPINGVILPGNSTRVAPTGILAAQSNSGSYQRDTFAYMPELGLKLGWDLTDHLRLYVGYDMLYISDVVRPGGQIDRTLDRTQIPLIDGTIPANVATRPSVLFTNTSFWAQGFKAGLEYQW